MAKVSFDELVHPESFVRVYICFRFGRLGLLCHLATPTPHPLLLLSLESLYDNISSSNLGGVVVVKVVFVHNIYNLFVAS